MTGQRRFAILASGAGTTATHLFDAVAAGRIDGQVAVVISNNSRAGVMEAAQVRGVPTSHLSSVTHPDDAEADVVLVVLAGYMKKLGPRVLAAYTGRILNTHPALLPAYGGQGMYGDHVHAAVLADGIGRSGATVHEVTAEYDEGPVVAQRVVEVRPSDDVAALRARVQVAEKELLVEVVAHRLAPATSVSARP
jgi:phosphoribosylglycinamide formyltransferase-1